MVILDFESTCPNGLVANIGSNGPMTNEIRLWRYFLGLPIETENFQGQGHAKPEKYLPRWSVD